MRKNLVYLLLSMFFVGSLLVSCGKDDDDEGSSGAQEGGVSSGRFVSECKASHEEGRSDKTYADIDVNKKQVVVTAVGYSYTGAVTCEESNVVSVLEITYNYTTQGNIQGADIITINVAKASMTPRTAAAASSLNGRTKYGISTWIPDVTLDVTAGYKASGVAESKDGVKMLVKTQGDNLYMLAYTGSSVGNILQGGEKYTKINPTLTPGTYRAACEGSEGISNITEFLITASGVKATLVQYSYIGENPTCEEANKLFTMVLNYSYEKQGVYKGAFLEKLTVTSAVVTIHNDSMLPEANSPSTPFFGVDSEWTTGTPRDVTVEAKADSESSLENQQILIETVGNILYHDIYEDETSYDVITSGDRFTKVQ